MPKSFQPPEHVMTTEEAIEWLRRDPAYAELLQDTYLDRDLRASGARYLGSAEFQEILSLVGHIVRGGTVLDLGAGRGIASFAFAASGVTRVYACEPDPSSVLGRRAIEKLVAGMPVIILDASGEQIPVGTASVDLVFARQVLHHVRDLPAVLRECVRVLKPGGVFLACREHVVDDERQLAEFLATHPVHRLAGGEYAYSLPNYIAAMKSAGLLVDKVFGPWDTVINAFPAVRSREALDCYPESILERRLGPLGRALGRRWIIRQIVWAKLNRPIPGRLYSFLTSKRAGSSGRSERGAARKTDARVNHG